MDEMTKTATLIEFVEALEKNQIYYEVEKSVKHTIGSS